MRQGTKRHWLEPAPIDPPADLHASLGGHKLVAQHLARKGITTPAAAQRFLSPEHYAPADAYELPDMERAVERLQRAISAKAPILIWGDFDVDGQTATALLCQALQSRGARVHYHVPNRFTEGHGIHLPTLKSKLDGGIELLLTCDTGISAREAVAHCKGRGVDVVITDHHVLPERLPQAHAIVNPQRLPAGHALRELPGVGVAYKLVEALDSGTEQDSLFDLVALGIVADVMLQVDDTRYLLQRGLERLRQNKRLGISAILENAQIPADQLDEGHIGFAIGPRLNALGRLDDANPGVELLTTGDLARARILARSLEDFNSRRRLLTEQVHQAAKAQIDADPWLLDFAVLVLSHESWHSGIIGIVASRLAEEYGLPTVLLNRQDSLARGSARSIPGVDITWAFGQVAHLLTSHGGHSMAAGLSLPTEQIYIFRRELSRVIRALDIDIEAGKPLQIDGELELADISLELAQDIERLAPFGNGNPPLTLLTRGLKLVSHRQLGRRSPHLQLEVADEDGNQQRVIWWRGQDQDLPAGTFDLAYRLSSSVYQGQREARVEWLDFRGREAAKPLPVETPRFMIEDYRASLAPKRDLAQARTSYPEAQLWAEATRMEGAVNRLELKPCETLIVWSAPPSDQVWAAMLEAAKPKRLILFGAPKAFDELKPFLRRLAGLAKFSVNQRGGMAGLQELAAATGANESTVQLGLQLLRAQGTLGFIVTRGGDYRFKRAAAQPSSQVDALKRRLDMRLNESRAYRKYWLNMRIE